MRPRSAKLTNVNAACASRHRVVRDAFKLLLTRYIKMNALCHTANMEHMGFDDNEPSLWNTLCNLRYSQSHTCPPLQFLKSSYLKATTRLAFRTHSALLVDDAIIAGAGLDAAHAAVWEPLTWNDLSMMESED